MKTTESPVFISKHGQVKEVMELMETETAILNKILEMRKKTKCNKFVGAVAIEILKEEFVKLKLNMSNRDVFIEGVPNELDLLVAKPGRDPEKCLVYQPDDVLAVLEIRFRGSYGRDRKGRTPAEKLKTVFDSVYKANNVIQCFYVTISENSRHKYRMTEENLRHNCFELFTRDTDLETALEKRILTPTGDWRKLTQTLEKL